MSHYYTNDNNLGHVNKTFAYTYKGNRVEFKSDLGVFSKNNVDFGTHVLIQSLPDLNDIKTLLDLGCGVGVIGILLKKAYPNINVTMSDVNLRALDLVKLNIKKNNTEANVIESSLYDSISCAFDCIISNPPIRAGKKIVYGIIDGAIDHLNIGGKIYVVIQKKQGAESMMNHMEEVFGNVTIINKEKGYYVLLSERK